jgi:hypothetical protein
MVLCKAQEDHAFWTQITNLKLEMANPNRSI